MSEFYIEPGSTKNAALRMKNIASVMEQYQEEINRCASHVFLYLNTYEIATAIRAASKDINLEKGQEFRDYVRTHVQ